MKTELRNILRLLVCGNILNSNCEFNIPIIRKFYIQEPNKFIFQYLRERDIWLAVVIGRLKFFDSVFIFKKYNCATFHQFQVKFFFWTARMNYFSPIILFSYDQWWLIYNFISSHIWFRQFRFNNDIIIISLLFAYKIDSKLIHSVSISIDVSCIYCSSELSPVTI